MNNTTVVMEIENMRGGVVMRGEMLWYVREEISLGILGAFVAGGSSW